MADEREREFVWAKVYCDLPRDKKLTVRCPMDRWLYTVLILLARENKAEPGTVNPEEARVRWLANYSGHTLKGVRDALCYFENKAMIATTPDGGLRLLNFQKRQESKDPTGAERMRRFRNKHRNEVTPDAVTRDAKLRVEEQRNRGTEPNPRTSDLATTATASAPGRADSKPLGEIPEYALSDVLETMLTEEDATWAKTQPQPLLTAVEVHSASQEFLLYWQGRPHEKRTIRAWRHLWQQAILHKAEEKGRRLARAAS